MRWAHHLCLLLSWLLALTANAEQPERKRLLLLVQGPDGHPAGTHEYVEGMEIISAQLQQSAELDLITMRADEPWNAGPEELARADGAVLYLAEGARWIASDPRRLQAFQQLADRGGGLSCLHWAMGTRDAQYIEAFVQLFGGCHGGPDRKFQVLETVLTPAPDGIAADAKPFTVHDEFYYRLKFAQEPKITPLWQTIIDNQNETVAWTWERANAGRSFGFSGGHFHENWRREEYLGLVRDGILWTMCVEHETE